MTPFMIDTVITAVPWSAFRELGPAAAQAEYRRVAWVVGQRQHRW